MQISMARRRGVFVISASVALNTALVEPAAAAGFADFLNNIVTEFDAAKQPVALIALMLVGAGWLFNFVDLRRAGWAVAGVVLLYASTEVLTMITA
ncbi:TrbC/VirB2 family protein [Cereibacter sphaeroides]|uniref:TrbC/VirB2 family protein n=1 Tax=Cereibacter sphaeroides TaxID=1063 RepID=UPI001F3EE0C1|nr:TrbC/VirB2 family protein [Cereibacter sphaeroides]MCE6958112.1 TrbC/VirB2 family protein [Cereibacter sphaeroides]MCE6971651.1 TrbC/VirB2 family protein [Cereibacter sphaeroides]